ncbi:MAG: hypothetical protein JO257_16235 [Deltaproteobacteria bacterium]|nr:hypothetical protein [Deltaproteobacteria bacterium]
MVLALAGLAVGSRGYAVADPPAHPPTRAQTVEVLAYGFPTIDERDLGVLFTADLSPLDGGPRLYDNVKPKRIARHEVDKHLYRASEMNRVDGGGQFLFVGLDVQQTETHDALVFHSHEVKDVIAIDDSSQRSAVEPPPTAVFYLAEIHMGSTVDLTMESDYVENAQTLSALFAQGNVSASKAKAVATSTVNLHGLGVTDITGEGVFSTDLDQIRNNFRADPAPIELVFRTIPGRVYEPKMIARVVNETAFKLADTKVRSWNLQPGKYRVIGTSAPNGLAIIWNGAVECDEPAEAEAQRVATTCAVHTSATLLIRNPGISHDFADELTTGPTETMNLFVARLPDPVEVADADTTRVVNFFDALVATTIRDSKSCDKMASEVNALIDANVEVVALSHRLKNSAEWLTTHLNNGLARLKPAVQRCASSDLVKAAFQRLH